MALIQRYSTELSARAAATHRINEENQSIEHLLQNVASFRRQDENEKNYLHSLNDRLEELIRSLDDLEHANKRLRDDLNSLITSWGINGENRARFLQELDQIIGRLSEENRLKMIRQAETRIFDEQTQMTERVAAVFTDLFNLYRDKCQILADLTTELEEELRKIRHRLEISDDQVKSHDDDYKKELMKFRSYLNEWSQLALDKQNLLHEIQSLKERYNLRLAYNQEEINEWQRLLNRISQESKNFYRDYLDTIKQQIRIDYEQMAKDQQLDIEIQLKSRLKEIQDKMDLGLPIDENEERRRQEETHRFETRLDQHTQEFENLQHDYRILAEEIQRKRRALKDLENELRSKTRKTAEDHARLERDTDSIRAEYYALKDELDRLVYMLRFSVEEELKIYEALLNSIQRKKDDEHLPSIEDSKYRQTLKTTHTTDAFSSGGESTGFYRSQPNLHETRTDINEQSTNYRPLLIKETSRSFVTGKADDLIKHRRSPLFNESLRNFSSIRSDDLNRYRSTPLLTDTVTTINKNVKHQDDDHLPILRIDEPEKPRSNWTYETVSSGTTSSSHGDSTDRDRSIERTILPTRLDNAGFGIQQNLFDQNRTTTTTTRTTRRFSQDSDLKQYQRDLSGSRKDREIMPTVPELDETLLQSKIHITRKYKGNILIKFVDVNGRFVEIENTGNQARDLTGWYIERIVDGQKFDYTFPVYELDAHKTVRIYGNYHRRSSATDEEHHLQLIAPNFYDWGTGRIMKTELFNRDDVAKALFEQTIKD